MSDAALAEQPNTASDAGVTDSAPPSAAEAVKIAMDKQRSKTDQAADTLKGAETDAPNASKGPSTPEAGEVDEAAAKRSEAAKKGAETKRKNAEAAKEAEAAESAKASEDRVKEAEARAEKAEKAAEKAAAKAEPAEGEAPAENAEPSEYTPPKEWSQEAKDEWESTPKSVQDQVSRMQSEFEKGFEKYKDGADKWSRVEPYEQLAAAFKADLPTVLEDYKSMSEMMRRNPIEGINYLAGRHGLSLTQLAEQVLGRQGNETFKQLEDNYQKLHNYAKQLEARVKQIDDKQLSDNRNYIDTVRVKHRDDWDAIEADVQFMLKNHQGLGNTPNERLDNAVRKAYALNGLTFPSSETVSKASAETVAKDEAKSAETAKATPSAGSQSGTTPKTEGPASSAMEAVKRARAKQRGR
jgi:hypothetical protein